MRIAIAGPIRVGALRQFLREDSEPFSDWGLGGAPVNRLCEELLGRGHSLSIVTLDPRVSAPITLSGEHLKISIGPFRPKRARDLFAKERAFISMELERAEADVVNAHWTYEYALGALDSSLPHVISAHDAPLRILALNPIPYRMARTVMAFAALRRTRRLTVVSPYVGEHVRKFFGYSGPIAVVPNGIGRDTFAARGRRRTCDAGFTFATVLNGWSTLKNPHAALKAFARVRRVHASSRLLMFGTDFEVDGPAHQWARINYLEKGVEFRGAVQNSNLLDALRREVDVLIHPSLEEAHPVSVVEAMALAIPVVGGISSGGVPYTIQDGHSGLLVDVRSPEKIADAMCALISDPEMLFRMSEASLTRASQAYSMDEITERYLGEYVAAIGERQ